jgi:hypothetical protein
MTYPQEPELREEHLAIVLAQLFAHERASIRDYVAELTPAFFGHLLRPLADRTRHSYWESHSHAILKGLIAGQVLMLIKQIQDAGYVGSVNNAVLLLQHEAQCKRAETRMPQSQASLRAAWGSYASVAHLWAAYHLFQARVIPEWRALASPDGFLTFLACAEFWRDFGINHIADPTHRKMHTPTLSPEKTWTVPDTFSLPQRDFLIPALANTQRAKLDYKSRKGASRLIQRDISRR